MIDNQPAPGTLTDEQVAHVRETGALEAMLQDQRQYVLIAYEVYPNGTTEGPVQDQAVCREIGEAIAIGDPEDPQGWGVWRVPLPAERRPNHLEAFAAGFAACLPHSVPDPGEIEAAYERWLSAWVPPTGSATDR